MDALRQPLHHGVSRQGLAAATEAAVVLPLHNSSSVVMNGFSSLLLLGSLVLQSVLAYRDPFQLRREHQVRKRDVDSFLDSEIPTALERLLCNIGPDGCEASGLPPGVVIASPSRNDPDCEPPLPRLPPEGGRPGRER